MNILVLGGAGFVGGALVERLVTRYPKYHITILDNFSHSRREYLNELEKRPSVRVVEASIEDEQILPKVIAEHNPNIMVNATFTDENSVASDTFVKGTNTVLSLLAFAKNSVTKYIHISSDEVYGERENWGEVVVQPRLETDMLYPVHPVAAIQAGGDLLALSYARSKKLPITILRTSNTFGPRQNPERLLPMLIQHALKNEDIPIYGDGTHTRDWLYIDDLVSAIDDIIQAPAQKTHGEIFNVSGDIVLSVLELTELILTILNRPKELMTFIEDKNPDHMRRVLDSEKIRTEIGWKPVREVNQALEETIKSYQTDENKNEKIGRKVGAK